METNHIERVQALDEKAFRVFVDLNKSKVINTCFSFVRNRQDAEDIAQEVFVEVYFSIKKFQGKSSINTWLYRISVNKSLDFIRKKNRKKRFAAVLSIFGLSQADSDSLKESSNPLSILENTEHSELILNALEKLPENQKAAITLSKMENLSYSEIAEILKTTVSAVDSLIQRAKKNLKKYLQKEGL